MRVRCGHCKDTHTSIDDVRMCADEEAQARAEYEAEAYAERAYAEHLERRAEQGSWFGFGN